MTIWELRFSDGRGASHFTTADVTADVEGGAGSIRIPVAASVSASAALRDARRCFAEGTIVELVAPLSALAYVLRHELPD
jgi:hypothetical protein